MSRQIVPKWIRDQLPKQCCNCGSTTDLIYHHIVPDELGGKTIPSNVAVVCAACHGKIHYGDKGVIVHGDLVRKGQEEARKHGRIPGRKPSDYEHIIRLIAEKSTQFNPDSLTTEKEIMDMAGVKPVCYSKCKRMLMEAINAPEWPYDWQKPDIVMQRPLYEHYILRIRRRDGEST